METDQEVISNEITIEPINEIIGIGTKPVVTYDEVTNTEVVPYGSSEENDPDTLKGETSILTEGVDGERTIITKITYTDGVETNREVISDEITTQPVNEVIGIGTKPVVTTREETKTEPVPFDKEKQDDPDLPVGESNISQEGVDGERTIVEEITLTDGVETGREVISNEITTDPVTQITLVGTKEPDPEPETPEDETPPTDTEE